MRLIIIVTKYLPAIERRPIIYIDFFACIADPQCKIIMVYVSFYLKFYLVSSLSVEHCKFMDSKMRPLYLVFKNWDELGDIVRIIFKNGDGECRISSYSHDFFFWRNPLCNFILVDKHYLALKSMLFRCSISLSFGFILCSRLWHGIEVIRAVFYFYF